jgi:hypothetical protein
VLGYGLREKPVPTRGCFQNHHSIIAGAVELSTPHPLVGCRAEPTLGEYWRSRRISKVKAVEQPLSMERKSILWNGITFGSSVRRPKNRSHVLLCLDGSWRGRDTLLNNKGRFAMQKDRSNIHISPCPKCRVELETKFLPVGNLDGPIVCPRRGYQVSADTDYAARYFKLCLCVRASLGSPPRTENHFF